MRSIYDLDIEELEEYFLSINDKKFHANQLFSWLYDKKINNIDEMSNIKKETRDRLKKDFSFNKLEIVKIEKDIDVSKYLFKLNDCEHIEAVIMNHDYGNSICISSQVGCNM